MSRAESALWENLSFLFDLPCYLSNFTSGPRLTFDQISCSAAFQGMMSAGLLNLEHEAVRNNTYRFGERLAQSSSGQGHYYLLDMLSHLELADSFPHHCAEYYRLLTEIIRTISNMPPQVCLAQHCKPASLKKKPVFVHVMAESEFSWSRTTKKRGQRRLSGNRLIWLL